MTTSINIDIAKLRGWQVEEFGILFYLYAPEGTKEEVFRSEQYAWQWLTKVLGDFEHSADACIKVCDDMGWEWAKGFKVNSHQFRVRGCLHTSKNTWNLGKEIAHIYYGTTFALALKAALEGEME